MKPSYVSLGHTPRKTKSIASVVTYDIKPLVNLALIPKKSAEFCAKTSMLAEMQNSRYKALKIELDEKLNNMNFEKLIDEMIADKVYLHSVVRRVLGKYLKKTPYIPLELRKKVR